MEMSSSPLRHFALLLSAGVLAAQIAGCAAMGATGKVHQSVASNYYPQCYEPVKYLRESDTKMKEAVTKGAIMGGLLGAVTGALVGDDDHRGQSAAIGAVGGAIAGGFAGYYQQKKEQIADDNARIASYASDFDHSLNAMNRTIGFATQAQTCYQNRFDSLIAAKRDGSMPADEGRKRLQEIVAGLNETSQLIKAANGRSDTDINNYTKAYEQDLQEVGVQRNDVVATVKASETPATGKIKTKMPKPKPVPTVAVATEQKLQSAEAARAQSQALAQRTDSMVRDICTNPDVGDWGPSEGCSAAST